MFVPHQYTYNVFQLTPSRRATGHECTKRVLFVISTHALTEGDGVFVPLALHQLISTHALTEGDPIPSYSFPHKAISTHALTEGDVQKPEHSRKERYFNSRPHGGRPGCDCFRQEYFIFQLTPSRRATVFFIIQVVFFMISTHALTEGDFLSLIPFLQIVHFNSRPHGGRLHLCTCTPPAGDFNSRPHGGRHLPSLSTKSP